MEDVTGAAAAVPMATDVVMEGRGGREGGPAVREEDGGWGN